MSHSENARQWVHIGSGAFALLLRFLTWPQAALLAGVALAMNALVLPRIGGRKLYRPDDVARGFPVGILLYPLSILILILVFRERLDLVAGAWGVLACGDGFATLIGHRVRSARLPWNHDKSVAGSVAFVVCGSLAAIALQSWTGNVLVIAAPLTAAIAAALVESIPVRLDDNISVPLTAGAVLWLATLVTARAWDDPFVMANLPWAIGVNLVISWLGYRARTVSLSGWLGGAAIGIVIFAAGGAFAWTFLFLTFVIATVTSRLGLKRKTALGIAEEKGGRRGAGNAFANCGVAAIAAVMAVTTAYPAESLLAFAAALTAGGSDTVASEIGKAWGRSTFLITTLRRVPAGTPGAMSIQGTMAGLGAAVALAFVAQAGGLITFHMIVPIVIASTVGAAIESVLGATAEPAGILNNDMLNFINTAVAAVVAIAIA